MKSALKDLRIDLVPGAHPVFPPEVVVRIRALACELPCECGIPLSRFSCAEIAAEAVERGFVAQISGATVWRWLHEDAIRPWYHRSWIFPRDPEFEIKAGQVLDLYHRRWRGKPLGTREYVLSTDEKTSIQARARKHETVPAGSGRTMRVEHEYDRKGALAYLAALNVHTGQVIGRCEPTTGIEPFGRLVDQIMACEPYRSAKRVFLVVDNGSSHRGQASVDRTHQQCRRVQLVHLPIHASWLNQIEIYFSVLQRKALTPNDFASLAGVEARILGFQERFCKTAKPFDWKFSRTDLAVLMAKLTDHEHPVAKLA